MQMESASSMFNQRETMHILAFVMAQKWLYNLPLVYAIFKAYTEHKKIMWKCFQFKKRFESEWNFLCMHPSDGRKIA